MGALFLYLWLDELHVFTISDKDIETVITQRPMDNSLVFDRNGQKIGEFFNSYHSFVAYDQLPKHLIEAIVAIEDRNFWNHGGFDPKGIARASVARVVGGGQNIQGASTITQQVVRHFLLPRERSLQRKVQEVALAIHLERRLSKKQIIEIYANAMFLGNGSYGAGAAALRYFGRPLGKLKPHETAMIAGLYQSPSRYNPARNPKAAKTRQLLVIEALRKHGSITRAEANAMAKAPLEYEEYKTLNLAVAPYFIDYVREESKKILAGIKSTVAGQGLRIHTTLDPGLQKLAEEAVRSADKTLDEAARRAVPVKTADGDTKEPSVEASTLTVDPETGEILAMVGGRDYGKSKFNRTYQALRSPGSSFKPVVYALALEKGWKWSDVIFVSPITINNYRPRTPQDDYLTETTLMRAFYRSMNTPTIELGQKLGLRPVVDYAKRLGIRSPVKEEFGTMLGSSDVTLFDMARVYSSFANSGVLVEPIGISRINDRDGKVLWQAKPVEERSKAVMSPQIAFLMSQAMRAVLAMGTGFASAHLSNVAAGKTGTSNDATDAWFCGYSPNLVNVVWTGTDEHSQLTGDITGAKMALPIWDYFMTRALKTRAPKPFPTPQGVVAAFVHPKFGNRSANGVRMYFVKGNEPLDTPSALEALSQGGDNYRDVFGH